MTNYERIKAMTISDCDECIVARNCKLYDVGHDVDNAFIKWLEREEE